MWEVTGAKAHELRDNSLWNPEDAETLHRIVDHRDWQARMLPKIAKPPNPRARGRGRGKAGRGRGGRDGGDRPFRGRQTEGRKDSESGTDAADAAPAKRSATPRRRSQPPVRPARTPARGRASDAPVDLHCADACLCCQFTDRLVQGSPIRSPFGGLPRCDPSAQCRKCQPHLHSIRRLAGD